jgi:hypothetical protein
MGNVLCNKNYALKEFGGCTKLMYVLCLGIKERSKLGKWWNNE